jgi:hypothetical protein
MKGSWNEVPGNCPRILRADTSFLSVSFPLSFSSLLLRNSARSHYEASPSASEALHSRNDEVGREVPNGITSVI